MKKAGILLSLLFVGILGGCKTKNVTTSKQPTTKRRITTNVKTTTQHDTTEPTIDNKTIFVSKNGTTQNDGLTEDKPTTLDNALATMNTGDTIVLLSGTYKMNKSVEITNSGSELKRNKLECRSDVIFDFNNSSSFNFNLTGSYWEINNLNIINSNNYGFTIKGKGNKFFNCTSSDNSFGGFNIDSSVSTFTNCVSENNALTGYDAYGFYISGTGEKNVFDSCVSTRNLDSGFVIFSTKAVTFNKCLATENGLDGDPSSNQRSGFIFNNKGHSFENCIAYDNEKYGFLVPTAYAEKGSFTLKNCSAINNHQVNYYLNTKNTDTLVNDSILVENVLSYNANSGIGNDKIIGNVKNSIMVYKNGYYYEKSNTKYSSQDLTKTTIDLTSYTNKFKINVEVPEDMKEYLDLDKKKYIDDHTPSGTTPDYSSLEYRVNYFKDGKLYLSNDYLGRAELFQNELFNKVYTSVFKTNFGAVVNTVD